jgi:hypothetical protein
VHASPHWARVHSLTTRRRAQRCVLLARPRSVCTAASRAQVVVLSCCCAHVARERTSPGRRRQGRAADARRNHSAPFRSPREPARCARLGSHDTAARPLLRERSGGPRIPARPHVCCPVPACVVLGPRSAVVRPRAAGSCGRRRWHRWARVAPPSSSLESPGTAVPGAVLREPASFSALQLRPRPRNVKLARFAQRKAPIRWRHGLLPGMVRSGGGARCRGALSPAIVSWAQNCERADGASGEHLQQGCLTCKAPRRPSRPRQQGRSLRYCGRRRPPAKRGKAPPSHQQR